MPLRNASWSNLAYSFQGPWLPSIIYSQNDAVTFQPLFNVVFYAPPNLYVCTVPTTTQTPGAGTDWRMLIGSGLPGAVNLLVMGSNLYGGKVNNQGMIFLGTGNQYQGTPPVPVGQTAPLTFGTGNNQINVNAATCGVGNTYVATFPYPGRVSGIAGSVTITPGTSPTAGILFSLKIQNTAGNPNFTVTPKVLVRVMDTGSTPGSVAMISAVNVAVGGFSLYSSLALSGTTTFCWFILGNG